MAAISCSWVEEVVTLLRRHYEVEVRGALCGEESGGGEITILNRKLSRKGDVMEYQANERRQEDQ